MDITAAIYTLVLYKLVLLGIGLWSQRRTRNTDDYFLGGRQLGPVVAAISYGASSASAWTLLGMSGVAYVLGPAAIWIACGSVSGCAVAWLWIGPRLMRHTGERKQLTLTAFLAEDHRGERDRSIEITVSVIILISFIFYIAAQFQGAANTFSGAFNLPLAESLLLGAAIITIYTFLGGFWAASLTDTLQGILMLCAALLLPAFAFDAVGGWQGISAQAAQALGDVSMTAGNAGLAALGFVAGCIAVGIGTYGQPHLLNRFMALRDKRALRQAQFIAIGWMTLIFLGMFSLGVLGRFLIPEIENPETLFFEMSNLLLHPVVAAVLLAAVLSAIMSTADSMLLVVASTVSHDLRLQALTPGRELWVSRIAMVSVAVFAVIIALSLPATIFERVLFAWIAIGSAFGPTVFAKLAGARPAHRAVRESVLTGFILAVVLYLLPSTPGDWAERIIPFCAASVVLLLRPSRLGRLVQA
ncbi:sodium/proline symporter [Biformimicrobium ophioploci]|uniref:Sodium/proline symporter n=1 Tax=Biformimicrobium ophioploci TaxID=3036711 RepID=A0ABQ6LW90_9GAMM|nr:sodium/proline symporter [Microbulbifer sp. NKW57]GMG86338.1 sodium/proline symporter PutP [Microbulbifer sp. NKW57]